MRKVTEVELLVHEKPLDDGISLNELSDDLFLAILSQRAVTCSSKHEAPYDLSRSERGVLLNIPDDTTEIPVEAFMDCKSIVIVTMPRSVTALKSCAFSGCSSLTSLQLSDSLESIDFRAFHCCSALKSVTIPSSVTEIGAAAFASCSALENVFIPDSVKVLGAAAFSNCERLELRIPIHTRVKQSKKAFNYTTPYYTMLCYAMLYCAVLCYAMLCYMQCNYMVMWLYDVHDVFDKLEAFQKALGSLRIATARRRAAGRGATGLCEGAAVAEGLAAAARAAGEAPAAGCLAPVGVDHRVSPAVAAGRAALGRGLKALLEQRSGRKRRHPGHR